MNPTLSLRERLRESTRDAILESAAAAFADAGAGVVRMEDIAARAGIAVGTLYNYFHDRQALVSALLQSRTQAFIGALDAASAPAAEPPTPAGVVAELSGFVVALIRHWDANRTLITLLIEDILRRGVDAAAVERRQTIATQVETRAERVVARAIEAGVLAGPDAATYAAMLVGMVRGVATSALTRGDASFADRADDVVRVFLHGAAREACAPSLLEVSCS